MHSHLWTITWFWNKSPESDKLPKNYAAKQDTSNVKTSLWVMWSMCTCGTWLVVCFNKRSSISPLVCLCCKPAWRGSSYLPCINPMVICSNATRKQIPWQITLRCPSACLEPARPTPSSTITITSQFDARLMQWTPSYTEHHIGSRSRPNIRR